MTHPTLVPGAPQFEDRTSEVHPLIHAGKWLFADLLSTLAFVAVFAISHNLYVAISLGITAGLGQILYLYFRKTPIDAMQWTSLGLVVVFGGASLITRDPRFIMIKPTLIYAAIGAVMLRRGWMVRYMSPVVMTYAVDVATLFGYIWAGLMFLTGGLNIALALKGDPALWAWWIGVFPIASKLTLFAIQYFVTRLTVRARMSAHDGQVEPA